MHARMALLTALVLVGPLPGCGDEPMGAEGRTTTPAPKAPVPKAAAPADGPPAAVSDDGLLDSIRQLTSETQSRAVRADFVALQSAIDTFRLFHQRLPHGLGDLTEAPDGEPHAFIEEVPVDPWGNAYLYEQRDRKRYRLRCRGADGKAGTDDDVVWPQAATNGD